jgi:hypothetical protein
MKTIDKFCWLKAGIFNAKENCTCIKHCDIKKSYKCNKVNGICHTLIKSLSNLTD